MAKSLTAMEKECCSKCDDPPFASKIASSSSRCIYKGKTYSDGQHFAANSTSLMAVESNQCVQCTCKGSPQSQSSADQDGLVMCRVKTCLVDTCDQLKDTKESDQDCCSSLPLCQGRKAVKEEEVNKELTVTFLGEANVGHSGKQGKSGPSKGCQSGGRLYRDGASWHPVIGPLGQMDCVRCRCESPDIKCSRIRCKTLEQGNCPKGHQWRRVTGSCCPVCRKAATSHVFNASSTTIQSMSPLASDWSSVCVPAQYDFLVYKSLISRNFEQFYQFAFISTTDGISLYSWTLKTGK
ncbi:Chordin-like protein 2 [Halotydeus destructor]|nr:Chordin-like protein 2 [Halotydeus destructor]